MKFSTYEIELLLRIYPKIKYIETFEILEYDFKLFIIENVEKWLNCLYDDEKEIIELRYFKKKSFEHIAGYLGYKNHSSIFKKNMKTLKKIASLQNCN